MCVKAPIEKGHLISYEYEWLPIITQLNAHMICLWHTPDLPKGTYFFN